MSPKPIQRWWFPGVLLAVTGLAYLPSLSGSLLWDDDAHVTSPALQSVHGLVRIWTQLGATQQYYPLLHSVFWLEHRLWGDWLRGYHLVGIGLHAGAAWLFACVLDAIWGSAKGARLSSAAQFGALLFALHPVAVESVAWISEQKNTLSAVFYLGAGLSYLRWRSKGPDAGGGLYATATTLFMLALLTKSVTATLPAALLVVAWYRHGRIGWRTDVRPLLPWFTLGLGMGLFTAWVEHSVLGAAGPGFELSWAARILLAARVVWFYAGKLLWPAPLLFVYPHWTISAGVGALYGYLAALIAVLGALAWLANRGDRGPLAAGLYFVGTLFPVLGFVNVYPFLFSYVADHFQYLAMLGIISAIAAGWAAWRRRDLTERPVAVAAAGLVLCAGLTWRQSRNYHDAETLYRSVLAGNPQCWMAEYNLGVTLHRSGRAPEAAACYQRAIGLRPQLAQAQNNLAVILMDSGRSREAVPHLEAAVAGYRSNVRLTHDRAEAEGNLARALQETGRDADAIGHFTEALALEADRPELRNNYAVALIRTGRPHEAEQQFETTLRLHPDDRTARENLARLRRLMSR